MGRSAVLAVALGASLVGGCAQYRDHQGFLLDETLVASVQPGVDNRDSVLGSLGRPSFVGQFDQRDWYYVSRDTKNLGFAAPRPDKQTVLHVRFDEAGNVAAVERTGLERVASINPSNDKTPTLGQNRGFFEELFGNIGTVGATGQQGGTADNPQ
ncbi:MAG TPA: outer membrane protein assembly factor BamE [Allosphingosinicella sp.]|uniref:outer membrane protein assembly factor BamE n=1 Tax=Allosphingosinicella sp. TaxID=2823234 RepID=UPI002EDA6B78